MPADDAAVMAATQRPVSELGFSERNGPPARKSLPSWAVVATGDKAAGSDDRAAYVVELAEADLHRAQCPPVLEPPGVQGDEEALLDLQHHVDELLLGELERRYRDAELAPVHQLTVRSLIEHGLLDELTR